MVGLPFCFSVWKWQFNSRFRTVFLTVLCCWLVLVTRTSLHQRHHRYVTSSFYLPGDLNTPADTCSRSKLTNDALLHHFNRLYPQQLPWQMLHPTPAVLSSVISALRRQWADPESYLPGPTPTTIHGRSGSVSAQNSSLTHSSPTLRSTISRPPYSRWHLGCSQVRHWSSI